MKPFTAGRTFKNNKYYEFDKHGVTVMKPWPDMLAYRKTACRAWKSIRPKFYVEQPDIPNPENLGRCYQCEMNAIFEKDFKHNCAPDPKLNFLQSVPRELLNMITPVGSRHWHLLALFARCGTPAIELFKSTPALAWMLASSWAFKTKPVQNHFRSIRNLFNKSKSQQQILAWLDYPNSKQVIKLLRKIDLSEISVTFLLNLKDIINRNVIAKHSNHRGAKLLSHQHVINSDLVWLVKKFDVPFSYQFLGLYKEHPRPIQYQISQVMLQLFNISTSTPELTARLEIKTPLKARDFKTLMAIIPAQDNSDESIIDQQRVFPGPPYELPNGFPEIEYVDTETALIDCSKNMHNCLHTYVERCLSNSEQVFKLHNQEGCVFAIRATQENGHYELYEIKRAYNQDASDYALRLINKWLEKLNACNPDIKIRVFEPQKGVVMNVLGLDLI